MCRVNRGRASSSKSARPADQTSGPRCARHPHRRCHAVLAVRSTARVVGVEDHHTGCGDRLRQFGWWPQSPRVNEFAQMRRTDVEHDTHDGVLIAASAAMLPGLRADISGSRKSVSVVAQHRPGWPVRVERPGRRHRGSGASTAASRSLGRRLTRGSVTPMIRRPPALSSVATAAASLADAAMPAPGLRLRRPPHRNRHRPASAGAHDGGHPDRAGSQHRRRSAALDGPGGEVVTVERAPDAPGWS